MPQIPNGYELVFFGYHRNCPPHLNHPEQLAMIGKDKP